MKPTNASLWERRERAIPRGVASMHRRFLVSGDNADVVDIEGRPYVDFATGIAVCNTGHSHPRIVAAVKAQLDRFSHCSFQVTPYESYIEFAEKLNALAPGTSPKKTIFLTSGAEALENAVKIARAYTNRRGVITFQGGYHGRTLLTMAMTGKVVPYKAKFGPMPSDIYHARFPIAYHGFNDDAALEGLDTVFASAIEPEAVAAIVIEPVLGEGGFYAASARFLRALRAICDRYGILLVVDEVQSGFARTGKMFAVQHSGIEPDLMTIAKAMAGGFPISGVVGKAEIMDAPDVGGLGGTYAGSPLGCVAGLEVLKIIEEENLCHRADEIGHRIKSRLMSLSGQVNSSIGEVRGLGAMIAIELVKDGDRNEPNVARTAAIVQQAAENGLILLSCGIRRNVVRLLPALTIGDAELDRGLDVLCDVLNESMPS